MGTTRGTSGSCLYNFALEKMERLALRNSSSVPGLAQAHHPLGEMELGYACITSHAAI